MIFSQLTDWIHPGQFRRCVKRSAGNDKVYRFPCWDPETGKVLGFLTNNFDLPPRSIAQLDKCRWQVELFFMWIKQNLRIKHFFGTTDNRHDVKLQAITLDSSVVVRHKTSRRRRQNLCADKGYAGRPAAQAMQPPG